MYAPPGGERELRSIRRLVEVTRVMVSVVLDHLAAAETAEGIARAYRFAIRKKCRSPFTPPN
jgi:hypothetical protein